MSSRRSLRRRPARPLLRGLALAVAATAGVWVGGLCVSGGAAAQDAAQSAAQGAAPPCRTATLVVAGGAGSGTDLIARAVAAAANRAEITPLLAVRNIDGDDGIDGARAVLEAPGDGCMMLAAHQGLLVNFLTWRATFAWQDFRHVALLTRTPMALVAPVSAPFEDARSLAETARNGSVVASVGPGTVAEFTMRAMGDAMGVDFDFDTISGARDRVRALLAGEVALASVPTALAKRLGETRTVRPIAVTDREPSLLLPGTDTLRDQGIAYDYAIDLGILLPPSAPPELAARLADDLERALDDRALRDTLAGYDVRVDLRPLTQYTIYWENLMASWREIAVEAGYERSSR